MMVSSEDLNYKLVNYAFLKVGFIEIESPKGTRTRGEKRVRDILFQTC